MGQLLHSHENNSKTAFQVSIPRSLGHLLASSVSEVSRELRLNQAVVLFKTDYGV